MRWIIILIIALSTADVRAQVANPKKDSLRSKSIPDFSGNWYWYNSDSSNSFKIVFKQKQDSLYGQYCAVYLRGNCLDCDIDEKINIFGKVKKENTVIVRFNSFFGARNGVAEITKTPNGIIWRIVRYPSGGGCFAPQKAEMTSNRLW